MDMKKFLTIFALAALCTVAATTAASAQIYYGVKAGVNLSTISALDAYAGAEPNYGYQAGVVAGLKVPIIGIGVEAEALLVNTKFSAYDLEINSKSVEIPVMASFPLFPGLPIHIKAGPVFTLYNSVDDVTYLGKSYPIDSIKSGVGYTVGLGVKLWKITLDARYNGQFSSASPFAALEGVVPEVDGSADLLAGNVSMSLGFRF